MNHPGYALQATTRGGFLMLRCTLLVLGCAMGLAVALADSDANAQQAYGRQWGGTYNTQDWQRFYSYPYVYYPHNFWAEDYFRSSNDMYHRYPQEMRIPVYNRQWHNYYPEGRKRQRDQYAHFGSKSKYFSESRRYYRGHHFILDVF